jgi:ammonia channel protein AmtB
MPFGEPFDRYYRKIFVPAIIEAGLEPIRADSPSRSSQISEDIWMLVQGAAVLVADLSGKNLNVAYEIGLAHAIGQPVILVANDLADVPFDLRGLRVLVYDKDNEDWGADLRGRLVEGLRETLADPQMAVPPIFRKESATSPGILIPSKENGGPFSDVLSGSRVAVAPVFRPEDSATPTSVPKVSSAGAFRTKELLGVRSDHSLNIGRRLRSEGNRAFGIKILLVATALAVLAAAGGGVIPSTSSFPPVELGADPTSLLRKLISTILVYFMQFGFIAFEAGSVRQSYRRQSAIKNLVVFALSFASYMCFGWRIEHLLNAGAFSNLLDVAFNAGLASTVALIVANTITERGTLLVNCLCSMMSASVAYPFVAGCLFTGGWVAARWRFVDTGGGCVMHVLGGMFGLAAALWVGPRSKKRAWYLLGRGDTTETRDNIPFSVVGAFFLWFGWLGFNGGVARTWDSFLAAFTNTNLGAAAGGLMGLLLVVANMAMLTTADPRDLSKGGALREIANLERVILGMLGGLVAVTANATIVAPWQAVIEAMLGSSQRIPDIAR